VYACSGALPAIAGILATARLTAGDPTSLGTLMEPSVITAVVVGGTPLSGGRIRIGGTVAGAVLVAMVAASLSFDTFLTGDNLENMALSSAFLAVVVVAQTWPGRRRRVW